MQTAVEHKKIMQLIEKDLLLPSLPAIAVNILNSVRDHDAPLTALGDTISADPALTAKMLKIANSCMFSRNGNINTVQRAMVVLGTDMIRNIALSFVITTDSRMNNHAELDMDRFWKQSISSAVAAELLSRTLHRRDDDIFVTALLKNIGKLVILQSKGEEYSKLLNEAATGTVTLNELETAAFGFTHTQVSYALLNHWNLPRTICEPILYQTGLHLAPESCRIQAHILDFAEQITALCLDSEAVASAPALQQELTRMFELDASQVYALFDAAANNSVDIIEFFDLKEEIVPYSVLLQQANAELARINLSKEQMVLELNAARVKSERMASQLQENNDRLKQLVYRDGLTGLYNHRYFHEVLNNEFMRSKRYHSSLSLILFDIDHFKKVNDTYGHPTGDLVLVNLAKAVRSAVRPSDIVARYGGEEFAVILPETGVAGAKVFAARLRRCVEGIATLINGQLIYVTISAGIASTSAEAPDMTKNQLIQTADRALYIAKNNGRNQIAILEPHQVDR